MLQPSNRSTDASRVAASAVAACLLALAGCDARAGESDPPGTPDPQRSTVEQRLEAKLAELEQELADLGVRAERAGEAAKAEARESLESLRERSVEVRERLAEMRSASAERWQDVKGGFERGLVELEAGARRAKGEVDAWLERRESENADGRSAAAADALEGDQGDHR